VTQTRPVAKCLAIALLFSLTTWSHPDLRAQSAPAAGLALIEERELREWLTYLASDELQGRQAFSEGYGLAAQYVATQLRAWGVKPLEGDSHLQPVRIRGYRTTRQSAVTVEANGETRTFTHGEGVTFPANAGADQQLQFDSVEFVGYARPEDLEGRSLEGRLVLMMPNVPPPGGRGRGRGAADGASPSPAPAATPANAGGRGGLAAVLERNPAAIVTLAAPAAASNTTEEALARAQAALAEATTAVADALRAARGGPPPAGRGGAGPQTPDFTSSQRIDRPVRPQLGVNDALVDALLAGSGTSVAELRAAAGKGDAPAPRTLAARVTIAIDHDYEVVSQQTTYNVAGIVEGADPRLRSTYVLFGAHLDHVGTAQSGVPSAPGTDRCRRRSPEAQAAVTAAGRTVQRPPQAARGGGPANAQGGGGGATAPPFDERDFISNGADDDASGSAALLALARAFAQGPKPRRSLIFIWHAGEEGGLRGSRYNADFSPVPIDDVQAAFNMDMIGRDDCDNIEGDYRNTVFVVGADRISTDLHNVIVDANQTLPSPMTLDYELNDPNDPEGVYTRSDHYSYAEKGIPVAFFTTGLHPDYHRVSDEVSKIRFDKLARVAQLVYQTGFAVADRERPLVRDNKGPRTGFGSPAEVLTP
jgi:hypothetical protein